MAASTILMPKTGQSEDGLGSAITCRMNERPVSTAKRSVANGGYVGDRRNPTSLDNKGEANAARACNQSSRFRSNGINKPRLPRCQATSHHCAATSSTAHHKVPKCSVSARSSARGRFLAIASLKPVTKRANISSAQADKGVSDYLDSHAR